MTKRIIFYNRDEAGKLHCDDCSYDLPENQPFTRDLIGTPCPKCGADMLTERDYEDGARMFRIVDRINAFFAFFGIGRETPRPEWKRNSIQVKSHNGAITLRRTEKGS